MQSGVWYLVSSICYLRTLCLVTRFLVTRFFGDKRDRERVLLFVKELSLLKIDFGRTKAEMGCSSQKGLYYSFEILHGLLCNKNIRISMKYFFRNNLGTPLAPYKSQFWPENGEIWYNQLWRHVRRKISASADGGLSGGSRVRGHGSEDRHQR